jgi:hypothetical protein
VATEYTGTVLLTTSDRNPQPTAYTFTPGDNGTHVFLVSLFTAGMQTLSTSDAVDNSIRGTATVTVNAAPASSFLVTVPATALVGTPFNMIVTALDPYGNTATDYQGTVAFGSSDTDPSVALPPAYTFTAGDQGVHLFLAGVTLITPGSQSLTVTDAANGITGSATVMVIGGGGGALLPPSGRWRQSRVAWPDFRSDTREPPSSCALATSR